MCNNSIIVSYLVLKYWSICTSIWGLAGVMFLFCYRIVQIAQNSTKMYSYYNNCSIVHIVVWLYKFKLCPRHATTTSWQNHGIHGLLLRWLLDSVTATWVPFIRWFQNSSFPFIQNRIHFFFFQGGIRGFGVKSILVWSQAHGILNFETGFISFWDWFHICPY